MLERGYYIVKECKLYEPFIPSAAALHLKFAIVAAERASPD